MTNGFVNVLKPVGATASDIVVCVKHILHQKAGHLGTLDPGASGVLPISVGRATKLFNFMTNKIKCYRAFFTFGKNTDTLDSYGKVTATGKIPTQRQVLFAATKLVGELQQVPPAFSAISVGGQKSYKLARSGVEVQHTARKVNVYSFEFLRCENSNTFVFDITCSAGTYIRSLARDLAALCDTVGYMSGLIRLSSGIFRIEDALTLDEIRQKGESCVISVADALSDTDDCVFEDKYFADLDNGRKVPCPFESGYRKIFCKGVFFGLGKNSGGSLNLEYYLKDI